MKRSLTAALVLVLTACGASKVTGPTLDDLRGTWTGSVNYPATSSAAAFTNTVELHITSTTPLVTQGSRTVAGTISFQGGTVLTAAPTSSYGNSALSMTFGDDQSTTLQCTMTDAKTCVGSARGPGAKGAVGSVRLTR